MTKQTHFSRYNEWLIPLFGENYDPRVLYAMFNYLKLDPSKNEKEIRDIFTIGIIWNHMMITKDTIERLYPIYIDELDKEDQKKLGAYCHAIVEEMYEKNKSLI